MQRHTHNHSRLVRTGICRRTVGAVLSLPAMLKSTLSLVVLLVVAVAPAAPTSSLQGVASVVDGDTIEIHGQRIRLHAIDAPESRQQCLGPDGSSYPCGRRAAFALSDMIGRSQVRCIPNGRDRYRRVIAVCFKGDTDLNAWMVAQGWAVAFRKYGKDYVTQEQGARARRIGIWAGSFELPWDWRKRNR